MGVSARIMGREYGLNAQEMNKVLQKEGFLSGKPGDYTPTEKAMEYVKESYYHRGCGGYDRFNRYWVERTYDPSIMKELNVTDELKNIVRNELKEERAAKALEREIASRQFYEKLNQSTNIIEKHTFEYKKSIDLNPKYFIIGGAAVGASIIGGVIVYNVVKHRKKKKEMLELEEKSILQDAINV